MLLQVLLKVYGMVRFLKFATGVQLRSEMHRLLNHLLSVPTFLSCRNIFGRKVQVYDVGESKLEIENLLPISIT